MPAVVSVASTIGPVRQAVNSRVGLTSRSVESAQASNGLVAQEGRHSNQLDHMENAEYALLAVGELEQLPFGLREIDRADATP